MADGSNDAGGTLGATEAPAEVPADAEATGAAELPVEATGAVVAVPLPHAAKTRPAVASNTPARRTPNLDLTVTRDLLSSLAGTRPSGALADPFSRSPPPARLLNALPTCAGRQSSLG